MHKCNEELLKETPASGDAARDAQNKGPRQSLNT